ncbi:MAG: hypothetical protein M1812_007763 [Candelaria pacifica]|nr:MAG: hypothetical protein M1812_007763 [Candelaria pacifica]
MATTGQPARPYYSQGRALQSPPLTAKVRAFFNAAYAFIGLYLVTLFSLDAYASAESSQFNIHYKAPPKAPVASSSKKASMIHITSSGQFNSLITSTSVVVADFYADWCGPCRQIAPVFEKLCAQHARTNEMMFAKVDVDRQQAIAQKYSVAAMPTFLIFKKGQVVSTIRGADPGKLSAEVAKHSSSARGTSFGGATAGGASGGKRLGTMSDLGI